MNPRDARVFALIPLLPACAGGYVEATPEMEAAAQAANESIAVAGVSSQVGSTARAEPNDTRRSSAFCPCVSKDGILNDFTITADYGTGCTPDAGLIPGEVSGSFAIAYASRAVDVTFTSWTVEDASIDGTIAGSLDGLTLGEGLNLELATDLTFTDATETITVDQALSVTANATQVTFDGSLDWEARSGDAWQSASAGVELAYEDVWLACPLPHAGTFTFDADGTSATVVFLEDTPETGKVEVTYLGRTGSVPLCDFASVLF